MGLLQMCRQSMVLMDLSGSRGSPHLSDAIMDRENSAAQLALQIHPDLLAMLCSRSGGAPMPHSGHHYSSLPSTSALRQAVMNSSDTSAALMRRASLDLVHTSLSVARPRSSPPSAPSASVHLRSLQRPRVMPVTPAE